MSILTIVEGHFYVSCLYMHCAIVRGYADGELPLKEVYRDHQLADCNWKRFTIANCPIFMLYV